MSPYSLKLYRARLFSVADYHYSSMVGGSSFVAEGRGGLRASVSCERDLSL